MLKHFCEMDRKLLIELSEGNSSFGDTEFSQQIGHVEFVFDCKGAFINEST